MAITNFIPELWSAAVKMPFEKALVFGQPTVANRDYEGTIKQQGDTVNVTTISDPTIKTYDKGSDIEIEDVSDANIKLVIVGSEIVVTLTVSHCCLIVPS